MGGKNYYEPKQKKEMVGKRRKESGKRERKRGKKGTEKRGKREGKKEEKGFCLLTNKFGSHRKRCKTFFGKKISHFVKRKKTYFRTNKSSPN